MDNTEKQTMDYYVQHLECDSDRDFRMRNRFTSVIIAFERRFSNLNRSAQGEMHSLVRFEDV